METVTIKKLSNGFVVESDTAKANNEGRHCANMKGVVAELYRVFEGTVKVTDDQKDAVIGLLTEEPGAQKA